MDNIKGNVLTPNKARRNLNESFDYNTSDYTPKSLSDTPITNYSIVEEDESVNEANLKVKLRVSAKQTHPQVCLQRLSNAHLASLQSQPKPIEPKIDEEIIIILDDDDDEIIEKTEEISKIQLRRSTRTTRVSYVEFHSPRKTRTRSIDNEEFLQTTTPKKKLKAHAKLEDINEISVQSPSKLGFEKMSIASPRKRLRNQNSKENFSYTETMTTPSKRATRRSTRLASIQIEDDLDDLLMKFNELPQISTPKKTKINHEEVPTMEKTPKTPKTPSRLKLMRNGEITPSMRVRESAVMKASTPLNIAKEKLHVSFIPRGLPCREKEFDDITAFVEGKLTDGCGGCMYISGVPGTGKTATVTEVIRQLQMLAKKKKVRKFTFVSINGMRLTEPRQSYVEILKQLTNKTVPWEQAQSMLEERFTRKTSHSNDDPIVLLVDELDILCTKRQDVVYNLLDWPSKSKAHLIVLTIANTMDLPERLLMGRVTSRLGLTRLTFQAYTHKQLQEIVMKRLSGTNAFNPDAVQLVARKVASVSGDARRALDICRRAAEVAEVDGPKTLVAMQHVNEALNAMITQPKIRAIKRCSRLERFLLQAVAAEVERTGVDETTFNDVYTMFASVAGIEGFQVVSISLALAAISRLGASRLLLTDAKSNDLHQRLILNVSADDIYYALRRD